jgi:hypothetical protein
MLPEVAVAISLPMPGYSAWLPDVPQNVPSSVPVALVPSYTLSESAEQLDAYSTEKVSKVSVISGLPVVMVQLHVAELA